MRIAIIAPGSQGDVQPYIALGKGLKQAGHFVRLASHDNFEANVTAQELEFRPMGFNVQEIAQSEEMRERVEKGNFISLMRLMSKLSSQGAVTMAGGGLEAAQGMDLVLGGLGGMFTGIAVAEKLGLPFLQAHVIPFTPTRHFPSVLVPNLPDGPGSWLNRPSHHLTRQFMWHSLRAADNLARREVLGLPAAPFTGPYASEATRGLPVLYGFSPAVVPPAPDWGPDVHVTGYWLLAAAQSWTPPQPLLDFLDAGPPPVYIGFGSMSNRDPEQTANLILEALQRTRQRAVLFSGWGGLQKEEIPDSIFLSGAVPHTWLFPRMAAVVHHGGAGTTAAGLSAGVPSLIVPFFGDQPYWGRRVRDLGVGPAPLPRKKLNAENLALAIRQAVSDAGMRQRAAELGAKLRAEDGIARAVEIINRLENQVPAAP